MTETAMQGLPQIGEVLDGNYRIESLLGQGGFGAVYLARQLSMDRQVAIKVLVAHAMKVEEMTQRFRREVMAVRNLEHPNTIRIYDFRDRADGLLYYAMEYVRGQTLKDVIDEGAVTEARTVHIIRQVLKSLAEAHALSIVHRDLKPANIMLVDLHGEKDFVKVVDFGIAKILDEPEDENSEPLTSAGVLIGTLRYMSPEQITGQDIGPHSDLYALGLIGIEMLAGHSVFEGSGRWDVLHKQISDDPVEIPPEILAMPLGQVFAKALTKDPTMRYRTAEEMLGAFDQAMAGQSPAQVSAPAVAAAKPAPVVAAPRANAPSGDDATVMTELPEGILPAPVSNSGDEETVPPANIGQMNATFVANSGNTDQINREDLELAPPKSKAPLFAVVAILVVLVGIGAFFAVNGSKPEEPLEDPLAKVEPLDPEPEKPVVVEKIEEPKADPTPVEPEVEKKWIRLATPGTEAKVYEGSTFVGTTPIRLEVAALTKYAIKAEGYKEQELELSNASQEQITLKLKKDRSGRKSKGGKNTVASSSKKKDKKKDNTGGGGWEDITSTKKKDDKKKDKKDSVPLF